MSLRDEIVKLTTPAPVFCDPEDDLEDVTAAKLTENAQEKDEFTPLPASKLRQRLAAQSANTEKKYAGRKVSRTKLAVLDSDNSESDLSEESESLEEEEDSSFNEEEMIGDENSEEEEEDEDDSVGSEDIKSAEEAEEELSALGSFKAKMKSNAEPQSPEKKFSFVDDGDYSKYYDSGEESEAQSDEDEEDTDEEEENEEEEDQEEAEEEDMEEDEEEGGVSSFSKSQLNEEIEKGEAARQQLGLWDSLLEGRIKFQKILTAVNQLPQADTWQEFQEAGGDNFKEKKASVKSLLENLLNKLIQLQSLLLLQNSETQYIESGQKKPPAKKLEDPDEEEITSESESEEPKQMTQKSKEPKQAPKRRLPSEEIPGFLAKRHKDFHGYRDNTLQKWYDKTRLLGGKISAKSFSGFEQSALKQIEQILTDKDRLIKRTQMKRASYRVLGKPEESLPQVEHEAEQERERKSTTHSYDPQIFDDSDFYHQQLRELIERKTSDINDPIALSRQWLEIQRLRNKVKRKVETKASKGRKIRYHVHPKLVNFMAPKETCNWTDEARDDLFKSLFGQRGSTAAVSSDENAVGR